MGDYPDSSMISFLPVEASWVKQDFPHLTLVFTGEIDEAPKTLRSELLFNTAVLAMTMQPFLLEPQGLKIFGDGDDKVDVLTLALIPELAKARELVDEYSKSIHKTYKPHITIGKVGSAKGVRLPDEVVFDRIALSWGDKHEIFDLAEVP